MAEPACASCLLFILVLFSTSIAASDRFQELDPILVYGDLPVEELAGDLIVPSQQNPIEANSSAGGIAESLQRQIPLPLLEASTPGGTTQIRALGRSAEDVNVQTLGVPLNGPQGGGFDLSTFPQYFWTDYQFQLTPSVGGFDPRGAAGTLTLTPWTSRSLSEIQQTQNRQLSSKFRATGLYSTRNLRQYSAGVSTRMGGSGGLALLLGNSDGQARGPSGSFSFADDLGKMRISVHLLATQLEVDVSGPTNFPTPQAIQKTRRLIPLLQLEVPLDSTGNESSLKTSLYFDSARIHFQDADSAHFTNFKSQASQIGTENVLLLGNWRFDVSARTLKYSTKDEYGIGSFQAPQENIFSLQVSRLTQVRSIVLDPSLQWVTVEREGARAGASLGVRHEWSNGQQALFSRVGISHRFPSLVDRYFTTTYYQGNPNLPVEADWTAVAGWEAKNAMMENTLLGYFQWRDHARMDLPTTVVDGGNAKVVALLYTFAARPLPYIEISNGVSVSRSWLQSTGQEFPYLPRILDTLSLSVLENPEVPKYRLGVHARFSSSAQTGTQTGSSNGQVDGYGVWGLSMSVEIIRGAQLTARADNLLDSAYQTIQNYLQHL